MVPTNDTSRPHDNPPIWIRGPGQITETIPARTLPQTHSESEGTAPHRNDPERRLINTNDL